MNDKDLQHIGAILPRMVKPGMKPISAIRERLLSMPAQDPEEVSILYQHSVLCQTCIPWLRPRGYRHDFFPHNARIHPTRQRALHTGLT